MGIRRQYPTTVQECQIFVLCGICCSTTWLVEARVPFYWYDLTIIPTWISSYMPKIVWNEITYPFLYNGCNYLSMLGLKFIHVSKRGYWWHKYAGLILVYTIIRITWDIFRFMSVVIGWWCGKLITRVSHHKRKSDHISCSPSNNN